MGRRRYFAALRLPGSGGRGAETRRARMKAVDGAGGHDLLEPRHLASFEVLFRRAQLVECAREQERAAKLPARGAGQEGCGQGRGAAR